MAAQSAIVTLAIGEKHLSFWRQYCQPNWQAYAEKHGYDLFVVDRPLDRSERAASRSPAWQKCLLLSQNFEFKYRQLVILDSDIVINADTAPKITDQVPEESIGGVISGSQTHPDLRIVLLSRLRREEYKYQDATPCWRDNQSSFYTAFGLPPMEAGIVQTGVLVASPHHHAELFSNVYHSSTGDCQHRTYEQIPLSHAILSSGRFHQIDTRFNSIFFETLLVHYPYLLDKSFPIRDAIASCAVQAEFANNFFLHFAYDADFVHFLPPQMRRE